MCENRERNNILNKLIIFRNKSYNNETLMNLSCIINVN